MRVIFSSAFLLAALAAMLVTVACGGSSNAGEGEGGKAEAAAVAEQAAVAAGNIPPARMAEHVGEEVTVQGTILDYIYVSGTPGRPTLLLFDAAAGMAAGSMVSDMPTPDSSSVLIWRDDKKNFRKEFGPFYTGKTICVTGTIELHKDNPVIVAKDPSQIQTDC